MRTKTAFPLVMLILLAGDNRPIPCPSPRAGLAYTGQGLYLLDPYLAMLNLDPEMAKRCHAIEALTDGLKPAPSKPSQTPPQKWHFGPAFE